MGSWSRAEAKKQTSSSTVPKSAGDLQEPHALAVGDQWQREVVRTCRDPRTETAATRTAAIVLLQAAQQTGRGKRGGREREQVRGPYCCVARRVGGQLDGRGVDLEVWLPPSSFSPREVMCLGRACLAVATPVARPNTSTPTSPRAYAACTRAANHGRDFASCCELLQPSQLC